MTTPRKKALIFKILSTLILSRGLLCAFLLLSCSSAEASMARFDLSPHNIQIFFQYSQVRAVTNTPVNTWAPVCNVLKEKNVTGYSFKQWYFKCLSEEALIGCVFFLIVLYLTCVFSKGMVFFLWILFFFLGSALNQDAGNFFVKYVLPTLLVGGIILTKDFPRARKVLAVICLAALIVSLGAKKLVNKKTFSYIDDYSYPEYLFSSTSTNIVVVHEKMDLKYVQYGKYWKWLLFRDGRIRFVSAKELATLLQAQAEEIRRFKQADQPEK